LIPVEFWDKLSRNGSEDRAVLEWANVIGPSYSVLESVEVHQNESTLP